MLKKLNKGIRKLVSLTIFFTMLLCQIALAQANEVSNVDKPSIESVNQHYISNQSPLQPNFFVKLPVGSIRPQGWLLTYLQLQRDGLTGHLGEISAWLAKKDNAWLSRDGSGDHGWEEVPYWLKGYANLGYILNDKKIIDESKIWLDAALNSQRSDGYFGPMILKNGKPDLWGNMIMLWCLQSYYEYSKDERVLPFMEKYFKWELNQPDSMFLKDYWENSRGGDNLVSVYWLYNRTKNKRWLLELADKIHRNTANWKQENNLPNWHNVNIAQSFREPATYYQQTGNKVDLEATYKDFNLIRNLYGNVPGGMFGADENARKGYTDPRQGVETCGMVEQMASDEILMGITGDPFWADHAENVAFNTYPAAVTADFRALRYITSPNMSISDSKNHHPSIDNNGPFLMMNPFSSRCCQHNHSQGWPYYSEYVFMATPDNGIAALLYAEAMVNAKVGEGKEVTIQSQGHYPFDETISFTINHKSDIISFPFYLRVPNWCNGAVVKINGITIKQNFRPSSYIKIKRNWKNGDKVELILPMKITVQQWTGNKNSISVNRGPITYSLNIKENYVKADSKKSAIGDSKWQESADASQWPSFEILPASDWNYGLDYKGENPDSFFKVEKRTWPQNNFPFTPQTVPIVLRAKAKLIPSWRIDQYGLTDTLPQSPVSVNTKAQTVELIPMGAARLRISAFPVVK